MSREIDEVVADAVKLTLRLNKYLRNEDPVAVVMSCATMIGMALAVCPPGPRRAVRASVNGIINGVIKEAGQ
jgi:hypothetical protein